jgi:hypothetical protein
MSPLLLVNKYYKAWFPYGQKIVSQSFSLAEIQHFRTENMQSDYN